MPSKASQGVSKTVLPNGLTVLVKEDHSSPVVAINVWFRIGSVNEAEDATGLAHFQEHMVFKGTERHGVGEIANLIKSAGGNLNAATSYSYTMYYVLLPSRSFELGLDIQADAMMNSTFDPEEFRKERLVVIDEARMYDDTPDSYTFYRMMELGFTKHNYRRPIAGYEDIVRRFTREQLVEFYDQYYRPGNAVVVVVGDVDAGGALREIERVYGSWSNGNVTVPDSPVEPPQETFRFKALRGTIDHAYVAAGFHVPSILDRDYPALEMMATLLGAGRSSRLYRRVVEEKHVATTASAELLAEKWPGFFIVFASTPGERWGAARDAVFEEIGRFKQEPVADDELSKAQRQIEKALYSNLETVEGQASDLGYYQLLGDYRLAEEHREAIRNVTAEEIMYVAKKYFTIDNCSTVSYLPENAEIVKPEAGAVEAALGEILKRGTPGERPSPRVSTGQARSAMRARAGRATTLGRLDNGLRVLVKPRSTVPMLSMLVLYQGGTRLEPVGRSGLSVLASRALLKGTPGYDAEAISKTVEGLGGSIDSFSSFDTSGVYVNVLSEHADATLPVFGEVIRRPLFDGTWVDKEKNKLLKELAKRHDHPVYMSIDRLFAKVFGDHPYAHPFVGDESQLASLTGGDCRSWYESVLAPENMVMAFVGDVDVERAHEIANQLLGDLPSRPVPRSLLDAPVTPVHPGIHEIRRTNLKQAVGLVGFTGAPMMSDEAVAMAVLNGVLTGLGGRLFVELRDKRSLGYMTGSTFMPLKDRSIFYGYANPGPEGVDEAIDVILAELDKVSREPVSDEELSRSQEWLIGSHMMRMQRNLSQAMEYGVYEALGFGHGVVDRFHERIQRVTKDDLLAVARSTFDPKSAVFVKLLPSDAHD